VLTAGRSSFSGPGRSFSEDNPAANTLDLASRGQTR
jgi:hypothetical protein